MLYKYEEGDFALHTSPEPTIKFSGTFGTPIERKLKIMNCSDNRQVYKVKTTDNALLRIKQPVGALDPDESTQIVLILRPRGEVPPANKHYVGVYHIPGPENAKARSVWEEHGGPPLGTRRLGLEFTQTETD